jgi:hypothetical protein
MYLKKIATCKGRCSLHSRARDGTCMWLFQTQRMPAPYTSQGVRILTSQSDALNEGVCRLRDPCGCAQSADLSAAGTVRRRTKWGLAMVWAM